MSNTATESSCTSSKTVTQDERRGGGVGGGGGGGGGVGLGGASTTDLTCDGTSPFATVASLWRRRRNKERDLKPTWDDGVTKTTPKAEGTKRACRAFLVYASHPEPIGSDIE